MAKNALPEREDPDNPNAGGSKKSLAEGAPRADSPLDGAPTRAIGDKPADTPEEKLEETHDLLNKMLGDFLILRRLGRGGMAEVYLAEQTQLKRNVAVKVLHKDRVTDATYLKRFKTEAMAAGSLSHPNIIQVIMIGEQDGIQYIAQEYVPGMNLREYLARKGPPEMALALRIIKQVSAALQAAHAAGIVHRDIKPENIMLTRKGEVKVADFGLAQLTHRGERVNLTQDGVTMGTPLYMSPEQVNNSKLDLRTDIYSLGVTCYHMLSGAPPFKGETAISIAVQHLKQEPAPLEKIRGDLPPLLCRIVHKMMAKDPERRYQSAQAILKDLRRVTEDTEARAEQPTTDSEMPAVADAEPSRRNIIVRMLAGLWRLPDRSLGRQLWVVVALAILVGGASAGVGWVTRVPDPLAAPLPRATGVEKKDKAASQYFYALNLKDNLEAWQAVVNDFPAPTDKLYRDYAKQQLATLYLGKRRFDEAQEIFEEFAGYKEPNFRAFGIAGKAILLNLQGDYQQSQQQLVKLQSPVTGSGDPGSGKAAVLFDLLDEKMRQAVTETIHRNVEHLKQQMSQEWDEIFKKHEHADVPPEGTK